MKLRSQIKACLMHIYEKLAYIDSKSIGRKYMLLHIYVLIICNTSCKSGRFFFNINVRNEPCFKHINQCYDFFL